MKKFSKIFAIGLASTMIGTTFVGCTQIEEESTKPIPVEASDDKDEDEENEVEKVELRTVTMFGGTDPNSVTYNRYKDAFLAANPHIQIQDESATADETWKASVVTDFMADNAPDVMFFFTDVTADPIIEQKKVVSIEEIREVYPEYGTNINQGVIDAVITPDGKQYAIPTHGFYEALFVNEDLFEAHGIDLPTDWEKFEAAIEAFAQTDIVPIAVALGHVPHYWIEHVILAAGGVEDHSNRDIAAVKGSWVEGLSYFKTMGDMGAFPVDTASTQNDLVQTAFQNKQAAMFLDGSWAVGALQEQPNVIAMTVPSANLEKNDGTQMISGFSSGYYISRDAWEDPARREAAVKFVMHMTQDEVVAEMVEVAGGGAPAAAVTIDGLSDLGKSGSQVAGQATAIDAPIDSWLAKDAWDYLRMQVPLIVSGGVDAETVVDEVIRLHEAHN